MIRRNQQARRDQKAALTQAMQDAATSGQRGHYKPPPRQRCEETPATHFLPLGAHKVDVRQWREELADFEWEVVENVTLLPLTPRVTNDSCEVAVLAAVDSEPLSALMESLLRCGGYATVFVKGPVAPDGSYDVSCLEFVDAACNLDAQATDMTGEEAPAPNATVGMLVAYVRTQLHGVRLPYQLGLRASGISPVSDIERWPVLA